MRDVVGLDLDSVLCNTEVALDKYLREELGVFLDWENEVYEYEIEKLPRLSSNQKKQILKNIDDGSFFNDLYPYNYAEYATNKLKNEGFDIVIITSRPTSLKERTVGWLNNYNISYDDIYLTPSQEKYKIIKYLNIKAFVEDRFDTLECIISQVGVLDYGLYIVNHPWNKRSSHDQVVRVGDVAQAVDKIVGYRKWLRYFTNKCQGNIEKFIGEYRDGKGKV
jgi:uncharacterized HAD superfamily protein